MAVSSAPVKERLTRQESRARTRAAVLDAAVVVFARRGFAAASIEEIAAEAGFTRGAVYSNFADKDELFIAVLGERLDARTRDIAGLLADRPDPASFFEALAELNASRSQEVLATWELLRLEFRIHAIRHPEVRPALVAANRRLLRSVEDAVRSLFESAGIEPPRPYADMAAVVQGLDEGLTLLRLIDPEAVRDDLFVDTLGILLEAVTALGTVDR